jgi:hypothetical protein
MRRLAALVEALVLVGCSSVPTPAVVPPVIDMVDAPATATLDATGHATVTSTVKFHDDDDNVTAMILRLPKSNLESRGDISPSRSGATTVNSIFSGTKGLVVDYELIAVDEAGHRSAPVARTVTLQ